MKPPLALVESANQLSRTSIQSSQLKAFDLETPFPTLVISGYEISVYFNPNLCQLIKRKPHKIVRDLAAIFKLAERLRPFLDKAYCFSICNRDKNVTGFPSLSQSKLQYNYNDLLIPDFYFLLSDGYSEDLKSLQLAIDSPSMEKNIIDRDMKLYWRGSTNSASVDGYATRLHFINELNAIDGISNIASCKFTSISDQTIQSVSKSDVQTMRAELKLVPPEPFHIQANYLLHLDIDGHSSSFPGLYRKLFLGGCVFKVKSPFYQWYYPLLKEELNYISVASAHELVDKVTYYRANWKAAVQIGIRAAILARSITIESSLDQVSQQLGEWDRNFNPISLHKINPHRLA